jgi:hypothetical protein
MECGTYQMAKEFRDGFAVTAATDSAKDSGKSPYKKSLTGK